MSTYTDDIADEILAGDVVPPPSRDDVPTYVAGDQSPRPNAKPVTDNRPQFLGDDWDEEDPIVRPVGLPVEGSWGLLYDGKSHAISGPGGSGKTWLALLAIAQAAGAGQVAVYLDYEDNVQTAKSRLKALGVTKLQATSIAYWSVTGSLMERTPLGKTWLAWVDVHRPALVVIDSVAKACTAAGLSDSDPNDFLTWDGGVVVPLTVRDITSLRIDHTGHATTNGTGGARERGASSKKDAVSGASYLFTTMEPWTRNADGKARLTCLKDRCGSYGGGHIVADMAVTVEDEGRKLRIALTAPVSQDSVEQGAKDALKAGPRVLRALKALGGWHTKSEIQDWDAEHRPTKLDGDLAGFLKTDTVYKEACRLAQADQLEMDSQPLGTRFALPGTPKASGLHVPTEDF